MYTSLCTYIQVHIQNTWTGARMLHYIYHICMHISGSMYIQICMNQYILVALSHMHRYKWASIYHPCNEDIKHSVVMQMDSYKSCLHAYIMSTLMNDLYIHACTLSLKTHNATSILLLSNILVKGTWKAIGQYACREGTCKCSINKALYINTYWDCRYFFSTTSHYMVSEPGFRQS